MVNNLGHFVNGEHLTDSGDQIEIFNPTNGELISTISNASIKTIPIYF